MYNSLKKISLLFSILIIASCNTVDNDGNNDIDDPIIGMWEYSTQFLNDVETTVNDCQLSTIEFTTSGNRTDLYYDDYSGDCIVVDTVNMTWEYLENDSYQFTQNGFSFTETVIFENENNTLNLISSDSNGNGGVNNHQFVYTRIN
ncbi:hypothetical protein [Psychroserpens ponticola]|uniref:Lipocalin-like domain-containing protein n=1 Tax=Psychroserpens ponticola TaxID=2932268 RepID=A0ABY7RUC1_9FLAO|nr:hypothetical protein [Psychroserpens ponticola]WCO00712.1 hypothetical protein MUN68_011610 [Psychroserpens ponticola]